jgi:hypothetical protein
VKEGATCGVLLEEGAHLSRGAPSLVGGTLERRELQQGQGKGKARFKDQAKARSKGKGKRTKG